MKPKKIKVKHLVNNEVGLYLGNTRLKRYGTLHTAEREAEKLRDLKLNPRDYNGIIKLYALWMDFHKLLNSRAVSWHSLRSIQREIIMLANRYHLVHIRYNVETKFREE